MLHLISKFYKSDIQSSFGLFAFSRRALCFYSSCISETLCMCKVLSLYVCFKICMNNNNILSKILCLLLLNSLLAIQLLVCNIQQPKGRLFWCVISRLIIRGVSKAFSHLLCHHSIHNPCVLDSMIFTARPIPSLPFQSVDLRQDLIKWYQSNLGRKCSKSLYFLFGLFIFLQRNFDLIVCV